MVSKPCKKCGAVKPLEAFYSTPGTRDGRRGDCIECNLADKAARHRANPEPARERTREWNLSPENRAKTEANHARYRADGRKRISDRRSYLKRTYGITLEEYDAKLAEQGGACAVCGREPRPDISLHVDHDHVTGAIRGLLCFRCNVAIGLISEDRNNLAAIERYLDSHDPAVAEYRALTLARVAALPGPVWE
jgi:hypothetical protein